MLDKLSQDLIQAYREDIIDYAELLNKIKEYKLFLENHTEIVTVCKSAVANDKTNPDKGTGQDNMDNCQKEEGPSGSQLLKKDTGFEEELKRFSLFRQEIYNRLRDRADKTVQIQALISRETGVPFEVSGLGSYFSSECYKELQELNDVLRVKMNEVLSLDEEIIPRLKMELESVKLELHRLQGAKKTKNAYEYSGPKEARFIDKTK